LPPGLNKVQVISNSGTIDHINLDKKRIGKLYARNSAAQFEEAVAGNGFTAPALDPTRKWL